jgi:heme/copper-type cytochrome/quinol oxidase subunit 3
MGKIILQRHFFHIVSRSPWPLVTFGCAYSMAVGFGFYMHWIYFGYILLIFGFLLLLCVMVFWWDDIIKESLVGFYSASVRRNLQLGIVLFITTEVMFFFAFFWAFFHSSLSPVYQIGCFWPPEGLTLINIYAVPLLNTFILLLSGLCITIVHERLLSLEKALLNISFRNVLLSMCMYASGNRILCSYRDFSQWELFYTFFEGKLFYIVPLPLINWFDFIEYSLKFIVIGYFYLHDVNTWSMLEELMKNYFVSVFWFILTLILALLFLYFQICEYISANFGISDGIYGTVFFMATGFHGFHVFIGFIYLFICFCRFLNTHFSWSSHVGLQGAIWYWHFVDGVWLFLYIWVYCWGSLGLF